MPTPKYLQIGYIDNCVTQTLMWMNGKPCHMNEECCIDFSCCYPEMMFDTERRTRVGTDTLNELHDRRLVVLRSNLIGENK